MLGLEPRNIFFLSFVFHLCTTQWLLLTANLDEDAVELVEFRLDVG